MTDQAPQLQIPQNSEFQVPTLGTMDTNSTNGVQNTKDSIYNSQVRISSHPPVQTVLMPTLDSIPGARVTYPKILTSITDAQSAANTVQNHPATQSMKENIGNGPVADMAKEQHAKTTSEFSNLSNSRTTPNQSAGTGQPLTHYHSFFYSLLSVRSSPQGLGIVVDRCSGRTLVPPPYPSSLPSSLFSLPAICLHYAGLSRPCTWCLEVRYLLSLLLVSPN